MILMTTSVIIVGEANAQRLHGILYNLLSDCPNRDKLFFFRLSLKLQIATLPELCERIWIEGREGRKTITLLVGVEGRHTVGNEGPVDSHLHPRADQDEYLEYLTTHYHALINELRLHSDQVLVLPTLPRSGQSGCEFCVRANKYMVYQKTMYISLQTKTFEFPEFVDNVHVMRPLTLYNWMMELVIPDFQNLKVFHGHSQIYEQLNALCTQPNLFAFWFDQNQLDDFTRLVIENRGFKKFYKRLVGMDGKSWTNAVHHGYISMISSLLHDLGKRSGDDFDWGYPQFPSKRGGGDDRGNGGAAGSSGRIKKKKLSEPVYLKKRGVYVKKIVKGLTPGAA